MASDAYKYIIRAEKERQMNRDQNGWIAEYQKRGALWMHDGNSKRPHALLTSGLHSNGFFNSEIVMKDPMILDEAVADLRLLVNEAGCGLHSIDCVVGPAMGAITIAHDMARHVGVARGHSCLRAYTVPKEVDGHKSMVFEKTAVESNQRVLLVEDVLTTGTSVEMTKSAVIAKQATVVGFVATLVNRSGLTHVGVKKIVALIDHPMPSWDAHECPLCKQGSEAIRPKLNDNWQRLNAAY